MADPTLHRHLSLPHMVVYYDSNRLYVPLEKGRQGDLNKCQKGKFFDNHSILEPSSMNPGRHKTLLILSCGGMEFTWRYAWTFFLTLLLLNRPLPLPETLALFILASVVTILSRHRYRRVYQSLPLHFFGFTIAWILTIHRFYYQHLPLFNGSWTARELMQLQKPQQWFIHLLLLACLLLFWMGARAMVKRAPTYYSVTLQFDRGLGALFLLLLIKFMVQLKGGIFLEDPATYYLLFAFFTFSLIAISLARDQSYSRKTFRPGFHGIGIVLSFVSTVLIGSAVLIVLLLPYLTLMAESAQSVLNETAEPMGPVLVNFIRFLFSIGRYRRDITLFGTSESIGDPLYPDSEIRWAQGLGWFLLGVIGLIALWFCGYLIKAWVRWLLKRNPGDAFELSAKALVARLLSMIGAIFLGVWHGLASLVKKIDSAAAIYAGLLRWGRRSGLPAVASETPLEYGGRLMQRFPRLQTEIETIIEAFNREIYGQIQSNQRTLTRIQTARRRMRNPRYWPSRVRAWFAAPSMEVRASKW